MANVTPHSIYNRATKTYFCEEQYGGNGLAFLYHTALGRGLLNALVSRRWFSSVLALPDRLPGSKKKIPHFVARYGIDMEDYEPAQYKSFADFFTRVIRPDRRPICADESALISPCDGKLLLYPISEKLRVRIKGTEYTLPALLRREDIAQDYTGGHCLVFRLSVDDYHHFCFVDGGRCLETWEIPGRLHTVGPYGEGRCRAFTQNHRVCSILETEHFGTICQVDVGALLAGRIVELPATDFARGQEKGYFALGGSTIVLLLRAGALIPDPDILSHSHRDIACSVRQKTRIGQMPGTLSQG